MLAKIAAEMKAHLESLGVFNVVEQGFSEQALAVPPSAVFFLDGDKGTATSPYVARTLGWNIILLVSFLDPVSAHEQMNNLIDTVRDAFIGWRPSESGNKPSEVEYIDYETVENTLLVYKARVTIEVFPEKFS